MIISKINNITYNIVSFGIDQFDSVNSIIKSTDLCCSEVIADWHLTLREAICCSDQFIQDMQYVAYENEIDITHLVELIILRAVILDYLNYSPYRCAILLDSIQAIESLNYSESNGLIRLSQ
jgi:hypothetical protein